MGQALVNRGVMTAEQVAADLQPKTDANAAAAPDGNTPAEVEPAHPALAPPAQPSEYRFDPLPAGMEVTTAEEQSVRNALHTAGIPNALAAETWRQVFKAAANPPTDSQINATTADTRAKLNAKYGAEAPKVIAAAQAEFDRIAKNDPHVERIVIASGVGCSLWLQETLYNLARNAGRA